MIRWKRGGGKWWSQGESNSWPPACKTGALPTELWPRRQERCLFAGLLPNPSPASLLSGIPFPGQANRGSRGGKVPGKPRDRRGRDNGPARHRSAFHAVPGLSRPRRLRTRFRINRDDFYKTIFDQWAGSSLSHGMVGPESGVASSGAASGRLPVLPGPPRTMPGRPFRVGPRSRGPGMQQECNKIGTERSRAPNPPGPPSSRRKLLCCCWEAENRLD